MVSPGAVILNLAACGNHLAELQKALGMGSPESDFIHLLEGLNLEIFQSSELFLMCKVKKDCSGDPLPQTKFPEWSLVIVLNSCLWPETWVTGTKHAIQVKENEACVCQSSCKRGLRKWVQNLFHVGLVPREPRELNPKVCQLACIEFIF